MSTQDRWWDDQRYLMTIGMQSMRDHMYDAIQFHHLQQNMMIRIDNYDLQNKHMTAMDVLENFDSYRKSREDYRHEGPTNKDLRHPAVKQAWEEFLVIHRLAIGDWK